MNKFLAAVFLLTSAIILLGFVFAFLLQKKTDVIPAPVFTTLVAGESNPGRISIYTFKNGEVTRKVLDTGFKYVWTVRIGDAKNNGRKYVYAGVGNDYGPGGSQCKVLSYDYYNNLQTELVDTVDDIRCKDLSLGDIDNDGDPDLVLGTHGAGVIYAYSWGGNGWNKREIERNFIKQFDSKNGTDHRAGPFHTAYHVVEVGDADNDGLNELLATVSDPLEYPGKDHKLFINMYKVSGNIAVETIDTLEEAIPFKATVKIEDLDNDGKNEVVVGASHHNLLIYKAGKSGWEKRIVDSKQGGVEDNMKGVDFLPEAGGKTIVLSTGGPQAAIYKYSAGGKTVDKKQLANLSVLLGKHHIFQGLGENSLEVKVIDLDADGNFEIVSGGIQDSSLLAEKFGVTKFGWEATTLGFLSVSKLQGGEYATEFLDFRPVLALDAGIF